MNASQPLYTIGFTQKNARRFFQLLEENGVELVIDVRENNTSQLAGFTKRDDLEFFLKRVSGISYEHLTYLAPTPEIRATLKSGNLGWTDYERQFGELLEERQVLTLIDPALVLEKVCCLLCSEATAEHCHRRLVAEHFAEHWTNLEIHHL